MCAITLLIATATALASAAPQEPPTWHTRVDDAFAEARRAHLPILAVLHCPH